MTRRAHVSRGHLGRPIVGATVTLALLACGSDGGDAGEPQRRVTVEAASPVSRGDRLVEAVAIETGGGELAVILENGCPLPCREPVTFGTAEDAQAEILIDVYRGDGATTAEATSLGTYEISGFPVAVDEEVEVETVFGADTSGLWIEVSPAPGGDVTIRRLVDDGVLDFDALATDYPRLAAEHDYTARDGAQLPVRSYDQGNGSTAPIDLIFVHGSGAFNVYLAPLAARIADSGVAAVHTPDLRGHGASPERRGDIDHVDQLEDDLADLIADLRSAHPGRKIVVGGHSSGGGLAIRLAGGAHASEVDGWLLLAPFLGHDAPTTRPNSGGWANPRLERIIPLTLLNAVGITAFNGAQVLEFDLPSSRRSGMETAAYSFRMMSGINPRAFASDLEGMCRPALVVVGSDDEAFIADAFEPTFAEHVPHARVEIVPGAGHLGLVAHPDAAPVAIGWLRALAAGELADGCD